MRFDEIKKQADELDRIMGENPLSSPHGSTEVATLRATVEVAMQLAYLNEQGVTLHGIGMRGDSLCVSVESMVQS